MQNIKLVNLLKTFSVQEMRDFKKFISSPYFKHRRNLNPLYNALKKYYPEFSSPGFTEEKVFRIINPGKKYEKKKSHHALQVQISEMTLLAEKFIAIENIMGEENRYTLNSAYRNAMRSRNLKNYWHKTILKNIDLIIKMNLIDRKFCIEIDDLYNSLQASLAGKDRLREAADYSPKLSLYMFGYWMMTLSKQVNDYVTFIEKSYMNPENIKLIEMCMKFFDPEIIEQYCYDDGLGTKQLILTFYYIDKCMLNDDNETDMFKTVEIYKKNYFKFNGAARHSLFAYIMNLCAYRRHYIDIKKYSLLGSELSDFVIENGLFESDDGGKRMYSKYEIIFDMKLAALEYDDLKKFIDTWFDKIYPEDNKSKKEYSYAWLYFKISDFEKTLDYLSKYSTKDVVYYTNTTMLRIVSLYSLGHIEETIYSLNSYEHYYRNNVKSFEFLKNKIPSFIKTIRTLIKFKTDTNQADENVLNKIVEEYKNSYFHSWFKERVKELMQNRTD